MFWAQKEKRAAEDEIVEWHHQFNEHELGQTPRDREGQGGLECSSPWGSKDLTSLSDWTTTNEQYNYYNHLIIRGWEIFSPMLSQKLCCKYQIQFSSVQSLSCVQFVVTPWTAACQAFLSTTNSPEFTQTHIHSITDAIQPSHPLLSLSPPAFNLSQHQGLRKWVSFLHQVAKLLEFQLQHQSFKWIFGIDFL